MKVLVINCGSSSLKYALFDDEKLLARGLIEKIGFDSSLNYVGKKVYTSKEKIDSHLQAFSKAVRLLTSKDYGVIGNVNEINGVGHRVVHGGQDLTSTTLLNDEVIRKLEKCVEIAPLHTPAHLKGINSAKELLPECKQVLVFDSAFHATMPETAFLYAIPTKFFNENGIRRYGFHGTSVEYCARNAAEFLNRPLNDLKIVCLHLGNGASATAIKNGKSLDTSMGFTPLEGLIMGTRSGDLDPAIPIYLVEKGFTPKEVSNILNKQSGLLALSRVSNDLREIEIAAEKGNNTAVLALDCYAWRVKKYVGAYTALMNGLDVLIFTGGIGENSSLMRKKICENLTFIGVSLDVEKNLNAKGEVAKISNGQASVLVIKTNEEKAIALETIRFLTAKKVV